MHDMPYDQNDPGLEMHRASDVLTRPGPKVKLAGPKVKLAKTAPADHRGRIEYAVYAGGELIGMLQRSASAVHRMSENGRYRLGLRGYARMWHPQHASGEVVRNGYDHLVVQYSRGVGCRTRREALDMLLAYHQENS